MVSSSTKNKITWFVSIFVATFIFEWGCNQTNKYNASKREYKLETKKIATQQYLQSVIGYQTNIPFKGSNNWVSIETDYASSKPRLIVKVLNEDCKTQYWYLEKIMKEGYKIQFTNYPAGFMTVNIITNNPW